MRSKHGFTIVELLVVITIIGLLMALLLPAITGARNAARAAECLNQVRQLGVGVGSYQSSKDHFPGYISELAMNNTNQTQLVTWFVQLLPGLEGNAMFDAIQSNTFDPQTYLNLAVCPSNPPDTKDRAHLSYVINMGCWDANPDRILRGDPGNSTAVWRDMKANGVAHNLAGTLNRYAEISASSKKTQQIVQAGANALKVSASYISQNDGASTTILLSENVDAGIWFGDQRLIRDQGQFGIVWCDPLDSNTQFAINEGRGTSPPEGVTQRHARPSSEHKQIVNVAFCDGSARALSETIDRKVYARLMTTNGKESIPVFGFQQPADWYQRNPLSSGDLEK